MNWRKYLFWVLFLSFLVLVIYYFIPSPKLPEGVIIDRLVVLKSSRKMIAYSGDDLVKTYPISLGKNPIGDKQFQGDGKTPEGVYKVFNKNPNSVCYKNLGVSYPNSEDIKEAKQLGKPAGGDIKIHGLQNGLGFIHKFHRFYDWTLGCIAVTDEEMEELYQHTEVGAVIEIKP